MNPAPKPSVIIYTRPGCHLCDEAKKVIADAGFSDEYTLAEVNIEGDPELLRRYQWDIPVITINETQAFKHRLSAEEFKSAIARFS